MKIKTQLIITISTFLVIMGIIFISIFYTDQEAAVLVNDQAIAGNIENGISDLNNIADLFFLYQQDSQLTDWQSNITALYSYVSQLKSADHNQNNFSDTLTVDIQNVDAAFNNTVAYLERTPRNVTVRTEPAFQETWSQLSDALQAFSNDTTQLSQSLHIQSNALDMSSIILIITLLIAFALFSIVNYFIMFRRTLTTISELDRNIKIIGTGNFDQQVVTRKNDELGELSISINDMRVQLKKITTQLKEQERLVGIGQTAGMVGHDLRSPLQSIAGEVYLAGEELKSFQNSQTKEKVAESLQVIDEQIKYMGRIISDLQSFVKPVEPQKENVNLKKLVSNVLSVIKLPDNIKVTLNVNDEFSMFADPQLLKRVLINLVNNAVQAMSKGGILNIIGKSTVKGKTQVIVEDNGVGIPDEIKTKIFTPLFTTKPRGQGFGLAVCKRVIEAQGGTISFESQEGHGTSFIVELPPP